MRQKVQNRMAEVGKSVNMTSELGVSFHSDKKRECKRMGKRIYGIRSFAYRIPHPHAATASRLRLPRIWNPSLRLENRKENAPVDEEVRLENRKENAPVDEE